MTADRPSSADKGDSDHRPLEVRVEIITVGGREGAELRAAQATIIRELLLRMDDERTDTP